MILISRIRAWFRRVRRKLAAKRRKAELREFVYLDEISVYSLIASRLGPIATEFTETDKATLKAEITGVGSSTEVGSQVLRKSTVQTTFKELYEFEASSFGMSIISEKLTPSKTINLATLSTRKDIFLAEGWLIDPSKLVRGRFLEVEIQLEAHEIFRVSSVVSTLLEIIEANPEMFGVESANFAQGKAIGRILEKLLVGLVPITGLAVDYEVMNIDDKEWIVHRTLSSQVPGLKASDRLPLYVVGVAEQALFWKDVRRILFSGARFRVLCRLAEDGIRKSWKPVKLANLLDLVKPGLGGQIDTLGSELLASLANASKTDQSSVQKIRMGDALTAYAIAMAERHGIVLSAQELSLSNIPSEDQCNAFGSLEARRGAFAAITEFLNEHFGLEFDPVVAGQYRTMALLDSGLDLLGQPLPSAAANTPPAENSERRFLDSEFVGIYW